MIGAQEQVDPFSPPSFAAAVGTRGQLFILGIVLFGAFAAWTLPFGAAWPTPDAVVSALVLILLEALFNQAARFQRHGDHASYVALDEPIVFAMLLLLDWRMFVLSICAGELIIAIADISRKRNPTKWYVRVFNGAMLVLAGAAATSVYHLFPGARFAASEPWLDPWPFVALGAALVAFKAVENTLVQLVLDLANDLPIFRTFQSFRQMISEWAALAIGVPLAVCWTENVWLAGFALAALAAANVLLNVPEMEYRLRTDRRTGLTNAATFDDEFAAAVAHGKREGHRFSLLVIDIDNFKAINDAHGHAAGDWVIARFSRILKAHARAGDMLARVGGEEFTIVLPATERSGAIAFAERLRTTVAETPFAFAGGSTVVGITASIGVAVFPDDGEGTRELFHAADMALYAAKREGRNAVRYAVR